MTLLPIPSEFPYGKFDFFFSVSQPDGDYLLSSFLTLCMWQEEALPHKSRVFFIFTCSICWKGQGAGLWGGWGRHPKISSGHHFSRSESVRYYSTSCPLCYFSIRKKDFFLAEQKQFLGTHFPQVQHSTAWVLCHPTRMLSQIFSSENNIFNPFCTLLEHRSLRGTPNCLKHDIKSRENDNWLCKKYWRNQPLWSSEPS